MHHWRKGIGVVVVGVAAACSDDVPTGVSQNDATEVNLDVSAAASPQLFAVVNANGTLATSNLVSGVTVLGPGQYEVTFNQNVSACGYVVTTRNAYSQAIQAYAAGGHLSANGVFVETKNQGGGLTAGPFDLIVTCGNTGIPFAVVGYNGTLARSSGGVTLGVGFGTYTVRFPTPVTGCAFVASVNDPSNALVFNPSGVYVATHADPNTVYIETKNPGGGLQSGVPFHLAVLCPGVIRSRFAVVRGTGGLAWGHLAITSTKTSTGNYVLSTNRALNTCATVATRGSISSAVPFFPATVEIVPGPNANSIGVQVRDLLFFGGNLIDRPFHTASLCL